VTGQNYQVYYANGCIINNNFGNNSANNCNWIVSGQTTNQNTASVRLNQSAGSQCFRVTSTNGCGTVTSESLCITFAAAPGLPRVTTALEGCDNIRITWSAPGVVQNATPVTAYSIQIMGANKQWSTPTFSAGLNSNNVCGGAPTNQMNGVMSCLVSFATLQGQQYNLTTGSRVRVQASATNSQGSSGFANNDQTIVTLTSTSVATLARPSTQLDAARNCVNVNWNVNGVNNNSGRASTYELEYSTGNG